jgi:hypothetical protein
MAFVIVLKFVLGRSWRETSIVTALAVVGTWVIENVITQGADQYSMAYKQTDLMLMRLALPLLILVGGCFIFKSLRTWQAWAIILGTSAAANVASSVLYNWGGFGSSGYFPFGATVLLPIAALIAALGYVLSGEPV